MLFAHYFIATYKMIYHDPIYIGTHQKVYTMAKNTSVTLGDHFDKLINQQLTSGLYGSTSEVIRASLITLEDQEAKILNLRNMLIDGENSGVADYSYDSLISELHDNNH